MEEVQAALGTRSIVVFDVAGHHFAVSIGSVREIVPMATLSRPPALPSILEGFLNLSGIAVPVLRLDILFMLPKQSLEPYSSLVVLRGTETTVALLVQRVIGIASAPSNCFLPMLDQASFNGCIESDVSLDTGIVHFVSVDRLLLAKERRTIGEFQFLEARRLRDLNCAQA